jgi:hypothetical protein
VTDLAVADVLLAHLGRGADNARTLSELAEDLRVPRRTIEAAIQQLRLRSYLVCTDNRGAWLSFDPVEGRTMYRRLRSRYVHQAVTARAMLRTVQKIEASQLSLNL